MHFTTISSAFLLLLLASATPSTALPTTSSSPSTLPNPLTPLDLDLPTNSTLLAPRSKSPKLRTHTLVICQHSNKANCFTNTVKLGTCYALEPWWRKRVSSVFVDDTTAGVAGGVGGAAVCKLYGDERCRGAGPMTFGAQGVRDLKKVQGGRWNDWAGSVECVL